MGLPSINITFQTLGISAIKRSEKGTIALILRDTQALGAHEVTNVTEIPAALGESNRAQLELALVGYQNPPRKVLAYVIDSETQEIADALAYFACVPFDYLTAPADVSTQEAAQIASWVKSERQGDHLVKAVLPNQAADHEGIVNFTASGIQAGDKTYDAAGYCARIAGLLAGTPMTISCTYAPLPEVRDVARLTKSQLDAAIDKGELVLLHDGEKVKLGRGVNSFVTTAQGKGDSFKKIKLVEAMDMIKNDIRMTAQDSYIGKYANSYDNKCLLIMAVKGYLEELERTGVLEKDTSVVEIDLAAQEIYLKAQGTDVSAMSAQQIKEANTGSKVFLRAKVQILDAIEDIDLVVSI